MVDPATPGGHSFNPHPESRMWHRPVPPQVEVPVERLQWEFVLNNALLELIVIVLALTAADDLAIAFGGEHVDAQREFRSSRVPLHVEGFALGWVAMNHHGGFEIPGQCGFFIAAEVVAPLYFE